MGGSIDSMSEREDRIFRERMGMVDPKDYGVDVDAIDKEIDAKLAKVKMPEGEKHDKAGADE